MSTRSRMAAFWLAAGMAACMLPIASARGQTRQATPEARLACEALDHATGIRPALVAVWAGEAAGYAKLTQHLDTLRALLGGNQPPSLSRLQPLVSSAAGSEKALLQSQYILLRAKHSAREVTRKSLALMPQARAVVANERAAGKASKRVAAAQQLATMLEHLSKNAGKLAAEEPSSPVFVEALFLFLRDMSDFMPAARALMDGDAQLDIPAGANAQQRARLQKLAEDFGSIQASAGGVIGTTREHVEAGENIKHIQKVSDQLVSELQAACHTPAIPVEPRK
jgi:hypothetical protein